MDSRWPDFEEGDRSGLGAGRESTVIVAVNDAEYYVLRIPTASARGAVPGTMGHCARIGLAPQPRETRIPSVETPGPPGALNGCDGH